MLFNLFSIIFLLSSSAIADNSCILQDSQKSDLRTDITEDDLSVLFEKTKGCYTVIELWASWCGPCVKIAPEVKAFQEKYPDIFFLSISADASPNKAEQFWKQYPQPQKWRIESWSLEGLSKEYATIGASFPEKIPYFVVLDPEGKILLELTEPKDLSALESLIQKDLKEK